MFGKVIHAASRKQVGQPMRRRDTREHVALYIKAFNAWATGEPRPHQRFSAREPMPSHRQARTTNPDRAARRDGRGSGTGELLPPTRAGLHPADSPIWNGIGRDRGAGYLP